MNAIAYLKIFTHDAPYVLYVAGTEGTDTLWGLTVAHELQVCFGYHYRSGLEVAHQIWGIPLIAQVMPPTETLWDLLAATVRSVTQMPRLPLDLPLAKRRATRARLVVNLAKDHHSMFYKPAKH